MRFCDSLARRDEAQPLRCNEEQRSQGVGKMCNRARSVLTERVNLINRLEAKLCVAFQVKESGQLPDLGLTVTVH